MPTAPADVPPRYLTKHEFLTGLRCHRALWWMVHEPYCQELVPDRAAQARMQTGREVGAAARERVPGGVLIGPAFQGVEARAEATRLAMENGVPAIYEATFASGGLAISADILQREGDGWVLVEVKSASKVKPDHVADAAYQAWLARQAGVNVTGVELMHLNNECRCPVLDDLFVRDDVTPAAAEQAAAFEREAEAIFAMLEGETPAKEIGRHCLEPEECAFKQRCWPAFPEHHVSTLYYGSKVWFEWARQGYETIYDLPDPFPVKGGGKRSARQIRAVKARRMIVEDGLADALAQFQSPLAYLDFETVQPAIPLWDGCVPWEQVPVQFSCHVEDGAGGYRHYEWLAEGPLDCRPVLAERLLEACAGAAAVITYNMSFEKGCIERMAEVLPGRRGDLLDLAARLVDLLPVVRDHVYHPGFRGGFGLKKVTGPLLGKREHDDLEISEGGTASFELQQLLFHEGSMVPQERAIVRQQLLDYCKADTWEMVRLLGALRGLLEA